MKNPLISIIIPHYNRPYMLSKLLDTISDDPHIEILVIDDHSTENLSDLNECRKKYNNRNIVFHRNSPYKKGAGSARNLGITLSRGKYLLFADSDDLFLPKWEAILQEAKHSTADIIFFPPTSRSLDGSIPQRHQHFAKLVYAYLDCPTHANEVRLRYLSCSPWSKLIKRNLVQKNHILFDETPYSEDMIFAGKIGRYANKIQASGKKIYCLLEHEGCNTAIMDNYAVIYRQKMNNKYYLFLKKNVSRKDMRFLYYPYRNNFNWIISVLSIFHYELEYGYIDIGSSSKILSSLLHRICEKTARITQHS